MHAKMFLAVLFVAASVRADVWQDALAVYTAETATNNLAGGINPATLTDIRHAADATASTHGMSFPQTWGQSTKTIFTRTEDVYLPPFDCTNESANVIYLAQPTYVNADGKAVITNQALCVPIPTSVFSNTVQGTALLRFRMDANQPRPEYQYLLNMGYSWKKGGFAITYRASTEEIGYVYGNASQSWFAGLATNAANPTVTDVWTDLAVIFQQNASSGSVKVGIGQKGGMRWKESKGSWLKGNILVPYFSPMIGALSVQKYATTSENQTSSFRGSIHFAAFWDRALSESEIKDAFATPRPTVFRMGGEGYGHEMFAGTNGAVATAVGPSGQMALHGQFAAGETTHVDFAIDEGVNRKMQALRIAAAATSSAGTLGVSLDGAPLGDVAITPAQEEVLYVSGDHLAAGAHRLTLTRSDAGSGLIVLDLVELSGSWRHGKADGKMSEFAGDGGVLDFPIRWGYTSTAHSKIAESPSWQRLSIIDILPASIAATSRYRLTFHPAWLGTSGATILLTVNDATAPKKTFTLTDTAIQTVDFDVGELPAGTNYFKFTASQGGMSLDYVDLTVRGPKLGAVLILR